jgi:uncharacterized protein YnzC (UPF0291/DUF896 family)
MSKSLILSVTLLFGLALFTQSCRWKTTKNALKHGEVLKSSINSFEKNRSRLADRIVETLEEAETALTQTDPDLPEVSKDFEKEWTVIQNRYEKLKKDFEEVGSSSTAYFDKLNELSGNINQEDLRKEELAKNEALRKRWEKTYEEASTNVQKVTTVLEEGNDFHMVLVASSIRQKLEQNVVELRRIADQAKALLADLESFTQAGRELVEG